MDIKFLDLRIAVDSHYLSELSHVSFHVAVLRMPARGKGSPVFLAQEAYRLANPFLDFT